MVFVSDRGEPLALMEPMRLGEGSASLAAARELAFDLVKASAGLRYSLPQALLAPLSGLVRAMNCYYSNLIEGHDTHPVEIERALAEDYSRDPVRRELQFEARAHIAVQRAIEAGEFRGRASTAVAVCEIHQRFYAAMPAGLRTVETVPVVPGVYRSQDVAVGRHVAVSPGAVPRFMQRFEQAYGALGAAESVVAAAAAHHRLVWIHPFMDGNGRVARLLSHATLTEALDTGGLWSVARGLARSAGGYKAHLAACDAVRAGDRDGRGRLSEQALGEFTQFFLGTCLDQVRFMEALMDPVRLRARVVLWAREEVAAGALPAQAPVVLEAVLNRGELPRGEVAALLALEERQARRIANTLVAAGVLTSATPRSPYTLAFPARLAGRWMPGLFPDP